MPLQHEQITRNNILKDVGNSTPRKLKEKPIFIQAF